MNYKNGYKVVYEVAADGKRTFYAATSNEYPTRDAEGKIIDKEIASFDDANFVGKTIYEHKGKFYVSADRLPAYTEAGEPDIENGEVELDFSEVLEEAVAAASIEEPEAPKNNSRSTRKSATVKVEEVQVEEQIVPEIEVEE